MRETIDLPDVILTHSCTVQRMFAEAELTNRIEHLSNGHDMEWMSEYRVKKDSTKIRFGYMGQIREAKGIHILVEAFQSLNLNGQARLDIWGDLTKYKKYVEQLQVIIGNEESITLRGRFERNQLAKVLSEIDILVVPSLWYENAPLVIHEAFATKTPVIATNLGGMAEAVKHEVNGLLFEHGDIEDLAKQLHRVVTEVDLIDNLREGISPVKTVGEEVTELEEIYKTIAI
jgi:glycosyltransferase involved in cell wall biosynthesis